MTNDAFARWRTDGQFVRYRGHRIFYQCAGTGPALLAIHGFPSASWDWAPMWPALCTRFRVAAADMIGFGWSDKPRPYAYSIQDQASLQEHLLGELGVSDAHVVAHDYGDTVAQELLARHEDRRARGEDGLRILSVCFLNGGLFPETHRARLIQKLFRTPAGPLLGRLMTKRTLRAQMRRIFGPSTPPSDTFIDELWHLLRYQDGHRVVHHLLGYMDERRTHRERWVRVLQRTSVPLRVIDGAVDPVSGEHMVERYRELVPNADTVLLDRIGHYPQIEDPRAVTSAFLAFHERVNPARPSEQGEASQ